MLSLSFLFLSFPFHCLAGLDAQSDSLAIILYHTAGELSQGFLLLLFIEYFVTEVLGE